MKYCLLWATCFIGLLQLSAVTCRSAHDKVIEKEAITLLSSDNEKYSTTVGPSVAYTGQEIERDENSTDKLALEPGLMSSYTRSSSSEEIWIPLCSFGMVFSCLLISCLCRCLQNRQQITPGSVVVPLQNGVQGNQVQNTQTEYNSQQKENDFPPSYESVPQYQQHPQALPQYHEAQLPPHQYQQYPQALPQYPQAQHLPHQYQQHPQALPQYQQAQHLPHQYQGPQHQVPPPTSHPMYQAPPMQAQQRPFLVEFENPVGNVVEAGELPNKS